MKGPEVLSWGKFMYLAKWWVNFLRRVRTCCGPWGGVSGPYLLSQPHFCKVNAPWVCFPLFFNHRGACAFVICIVPGEFPSIGLGWRGASRAEKLSGILPRKQNFGGSVWHSSLRNNTFHLRKERRFDIPWKYDFQPCSAWGRLFLQGLVAEAGNESSSAADEECWCEEHTGDLREWDWSGGVYTLTIVLRGVQFCLKPKECGLQGAKNVHFTNRNTRVTLCMFRQIN